MAENVWELRDSEIRLVDIVPVSFDRITFGDNGELRVLTEAERYEGIALPPNKFVVHTPHAVSGHPMRGGLLRATSLAYLGKHFAIKDWMIFAEVFGMPVRVARYEPSATAEEKRELLRMLESIGSDAAAIFSKAVELQFIEAGQGKAPPPYEAMCDYFNRELSKAWLGQTLTVETRAGEAQRFSSGPGVHNEVRHDLRQDDLVKEARTLRRDVLTPITRVKFGDAAPVPYFKRQLDPPRDLRELADILNVAVNDLNMQIPAEWAHRALGVPYTDNEEQYLAGKSVNHS
jgi:phage gp29-like protein